MISVNIHEAKTQLSRLLVQVETNHECVMVCRNGKPIAQIIPMPKVLNPLILHPELQGVQFHYDPLEPLADDEWPSEE